MGVKATKPQTPVKEQDIEKIAFGVLEQFAPLFPAAFALERLRETENTLEPVVKPWKLKKPKPTGDPLLHGWVTKLGKKTKSWKRRYFVMANANDNYCVHYYEKDEYMHMQSKRKGTILPCGYMVRSLKSEEDIRQYGENVLCLEPPLGIGRTWYIRTGTSFDRRRWKRAFEVSIKPLVVSL